VIRFVVFVALFATLVYLAVRMLDKRGATKAAWGPVTRREHQQRRRPVAPDDDEEFLRGLDKHHHEGTED
jgi:hypothetical protein